MSHSLGADDSFVCPDSNPSLPSRIVPASALLIQELRTTGRIDAASGERGICLAPKAQLHTSLGRCPDVCTHFQRARRSGSPGSARVSRAGRGVPPRRTSCVDTRLSEGVWRLFTTSVAGSSFRRDAETNTRDACAPRNSPSTPFCQTVPRCVQTSGRCPTAIKLRKSALVPNLQIGNAIVCESPIRAALKEGSALRPAKDSVPGNPSLDRVRRWAVDGSRIGDSQTSAFPIRDWEREREIGVPKLNLMAVGRCPRLALGRAFGAKQIRLVRAPDPRLDASWPCDNCKC